MSGLCLNPSISLVAYEPGREHTRYPQGRCFVKIPNVRGRFILTDRVVLVVPCPVCKSVVGEPCKDSGSGLTPDGYHTSVHADRRDAARRRARKESRR